MFNVLVIRNSPIKKTRLVFVFMEQVHLPQCQILLPEGKGFHYKVLSKLYRNSELNFLVNFDLILSALKRSYVSQMLR